MVDAVESYVVRPTRRKRKADRYAVLARLVVVEKYLDKNAVVAGFLGDVEKKLFGDFFEIIFAHFRRLLHSE